MFTHLLSAVPHLTDSFMEIVYGAVEQTLLAWMKVARSLRLSS